MANAVGGVDVLLFADDTAIVSSHSDGAALAGLLGGAESSLLKWIGANDLSVNLDKTSKIVFSHRKIDGECANTVKYLGVSFDSALSWEGHVDSLTKKISKNYYLIRKLTPLVSIDLLLTAYFSLIESFMRYGLLAWGHSCHSFRIFALQRKVIRVISGLGYRDDVKHIFRQFGILTLPCLFIYSCLIMAKRSDNIICHNDIHRYNTRNNDRATVEFLRLKSSRYSRNYFSLKFLNKLPRSVVALPFSAFKLRLKSFLIDKAYYSIDDFLNDTLTEWDIIDPEAPLGHQLDFNIV